MHSTYNVPIIPQNLRQDETIVQIADALKHLSEVSNDIFSRINDRIELNKQQLTGLTNRINVAHTQVVKLTGAKKATQVFSSSKYPATDVHQQYKSIFDGNKKILFTRSKVKFKELQVNDDHIETLQFYHLKISNDDGKKHVEGLGPIPSDIISVNDLFLYNTGKNPYKNYVMSDPLQVSLRTKKEDSKDVSDIGAAPHSISERTTLTKTPGDSYFYSPDLGEVPLLDVPLDLPDLPGIADDLRYVDEQEPGIAPSVMTTPIVPELPLFLEEVLPSISDNANPLLVIPTVPVQLQVETIQEEPKVIHNINKDPQVTISEPVIIQEPVIITKPLVEERESVPKELPKAVPGIDNAHASLMEAIRQAGGSTNAKLKTAEAKISTVSSGDLMADLHAKLQLRRKGISGTKSQENSGLDANSAMTKISAMIPPPLDLESTNSEDDEDWDA